MARGRYLKPSISKNEDLAKLDIYSRHLFALLPCYADCEGKLEDRPQRLHIEIYPYEPQLDFDGLLQQLDEADFITRYSEGGKNCILINEFLTHQSPTKSERDKGSSIPNYSAESSIFRKDRTSCNKLEKDSLKMAITRTVTKTKTKTKTKTRTETDADPLILEICNFYKDNINSAEIASGKKNLITLQKKSKLEYAQLLHFVKNYHTSLMAMDGYDPKFNVRMRNFFGKDARYTDYFEVPEMGPQNAPKSTVKKNKFDTTGKDYGDGGVFTF